MTSRQRLALALVWLALLLAVGGWVGQRLKLSGDLRKFMPRLDRRTRSKQSRAAAADDIRMPVLA
jgi:predicted exporter